MIHHCHNCGKRLYDGTHGQQGSYRGKYHKLCFACYRSLHHGKPLRGIDSSLYQPVTDGRRYIVRFSDGNTYVLDHDELCYVANVVNNT